MENNLQKQKIMLADYFNVLKDHNRSIESIIKPIHSISFTIKGDNDDNLNQNEYIGIDKITNEIKIKKFKNNFDDFYDIIIDIKLIKDIKKGWKIKMNEKGKNNYNKYKNNKTIKIGILGNSNKGKSFIFQKYLK